MRITLFAAGSRGDIQPCVVLGRALQRAGFDVLLAAPENFTDFVRQSGLNFHPLSGDVTAIMASETGREFMENGRANPLAQIRAMRRLLAPVAIRMAHDALAACRRADALVSLAVFAPLARSIADIRQIPLIHVEPTPMLPTRAFPAPGWPIQRNLGGLHNRLSGFAMLQFLWLWYSPSVNGFRRELGLPPFSPAGFYRALNTAPLLGAYSPRVVPRPSDWPAGVHVTGYWFPDPDPHWRPPPGLEAFLDAGDPPIYIGFGSMAGRRPEELAGLVLEALARVGRRGLLLTGWGGLRAGGVPDGVFVLDSAPHGWLFPRMAAVVHHGGAGTTAEGLRAGVPTVVVPFAFDQPFWGARIKALGLGPDPIPQKSLTVDRLAQALETAVTARELSQRAKSWGAAIRAEDGAARAVELIKRHLEGSGAGTREQDR